MYKRAAWLPSMYEKELNRYVPALMKAQLPHCLLQAVSHPNQQMCWGLAQVHNNDNGNTADDFYHRFQDDIEIMQSLGVKMFRMSLSWSRILPSGTGQVGAVDN